MKIKKKDPQKEFLFKIFFFNFFTFSEDIRGGRGGEFVEKIFDEGGKLDWKGGGTIKCSSSINSLKFKIFNSINFQNYLVLF